MHHHHYELAHFHVDDRRGEHHDHGFHHHHGPNGSTIHHPNHTLYSADVSADHEHTFRSDYGQYGGSYGPADHEHDSTLADGELNVDNPWVSAYDHARHLHPSGGWNSESDIKP